MSRTGSKDNSRGSARNHTPAGNGRAAVGHIKANASPEDDLEKRIASLETRLEALESLLPQAIANGAITDRSADKTPTTLPQARVQNKNHTNLDISPITYQDAFIETGGEQAMAKSAELVSELKHECENERLVELMDKLWSTVDEQSRKGYSTGPVYQHYVPDLDMLYLKAEQVKDSFGQRISSVAAKSNGEPILAQLKTKSRAKNKAWFKYRQSNAVAWYRLTDLLRATITYPDIDSMYRGLRAVHEEFKGSIRELNDRYVKPLPGDYRDIQLTVEHQGLQCELQLNTVAMLMAKESSGHRQYDVRRELESCVVDGDQALCTALLAWGLEHLGENSKELSKVLDIQTKGGQTLLHKAAYHGHAGMVYYFLCSGANPDLQDGRGNTPLHVALSQGYEQVVWALLDVGNADWSICNSDGCSALLCGYLALRQKPGDEHVARSVCTLAYQAGVTHIVGVVEQIDQEVAKRIKPSTALVDAAGDGNLELVKKELSLFANPNSRNRTGVSAMEAAIQAGHRDIVSVLLATGAAVPCDSRLSYIDTHSPDKDKCHGITYYEGKVYCCPASSSAMLVYDPNARSVSTIETGVQGSIKWFGIAGYGGRLFCCPHNHSAVLVVDPVKKQVSFIETGVSMNAKWIGIAECKGKLYCSPFRHSAVLIIDPETDTVKMLETGFESGAEKWFGIAACKGNLYCAPKFHTAILVIDPITETVRNIETGRPRDSYWTGVAECHDKLWFAPGGASEIMVLDTKTESLEFIDTELGSTHWKFEGLARCGMSLYTCPSYCPFVLEIDSKTRAVRSIATNNTSRDKWHGICAHKGMAFCAPRHSSDFLVIEDYAAMVFELGL